MKFKVHRTSCYSDESPCDEAFSGTYIPVDERTFKSPEEHDSRFPRETKWLDKWTNHRLTKVGIARDMPPAPCWYVEINTLDELVAMSEKYGQLVLDGNDLEIYDTYRE